MIVVSPHHSATPSLLSVRRLRRTVTIESTAQFAVSLTSSGAFSYQWQLNGTNLPVSGVISTIAGNGTNAYNGDGEPATNADISSPTGLIVDSYGNILFSDSGNCRIRRIDTNGIITTLVGNGSNSYSGDGGLATAACIASPGGLTIQSNGSLILADTGNQVVRCVNTNNIISTIAGNGSAGFSGDGGPATNASLWDPSWVTCDTLGDIFDSDMANDRIREIFTNGVINTVAGSSSPFYAGDGILATDAGLWWPEGIVIEGNGNLIIADSLNGRIRMVNSIGIISTIAGNGEFGFSGDGGPATNAMIFEPNALTLDRSGNLFISDMYRVREIFSNGIINTVAGNGLSGYSGDGGFADSTSLSGPHGICFDGAGNLYISDNGNNRIRKVVGIPPSMTTLPLLTLNNLTEASMGKYSLVISDTSGNSITSSVANLSITLPSLQIRLAGTNVVLIWVGVNLFL
jgi:sugar lactone lactonase YvrE